MFYKQKQNNRNNNNNSALCKLATSKLGGSQVAHTIKMGFPRILSKNNKIYTKLGEFCLSSDGTHWIVCHTCQEELQTQDHFWKHIQDEHNFMQQNQEHKLTNASGNFIKTSFETTPAPLMPLPLYRKQSGDDQSDESREQHEPKDYTEMRVIEPNAVEIDIKVEPTSINQALNAAAAGQQTPQVGVGGGVPPLYQMPQVPTAGSTYATIMHTPTLPQLSMSMAPGVPTAAASAMIPQELPKDSNSTTASASSAVSSDDGERWYMCDFETCGLKFKYQSRLELHRSVHSKDRKFSCDMCGASFKQSCNLSTHRKKKHFLKGCKGTSIMQQRF